MEPVYEEAEAEHHLRKPFIFRGEAVDRKKEKLVFPVAFFILLCRPLQMKDEKPGGSGSGGGSSASEPSPFVPAAKSQKRERPSAFSPTEDTFKDTANLVKEDSDV